MKALNDVWALFETTLFVQPSTPVLFNQYADVDVRCDRGDAAAIRRQNLRNYLSSFVRNPDVLVVGEAPGPWGCRFSGVPFTSEVQLVSGLVPFQGRQSSNAKEPYDERTAHVFWQVVAPYQPQVFIWNCVPFHPHPAGKALAIRTPTASEEEAHGQLLADLWSLLGPKVVISIGRHAERALSRLGVESYYVPHPSRRAGEFRGRMVQRLGAL